MAAPKSEGIQTVRIPFLGNPTNRDTVTTKDQRFLNVYFDILEGAEGAKAFFLVKRPGYSQLNQPPAGAAVGRGVYSWNGNLYSVFGTKIYKGTTDLGVTLTTSSGLCGITEVHPAATTQRLCINDGVKLYLIATNDVVTTVTTIPTPNTRDLIYFDRYLFTLKTDGSIWQCDLDDPTVWDVTKIIYAQMYNGIGVALGHQNNLVYCFSREAIQGFYDAANASGSVLSNVEQVAQQIGCSSKDSLFHDEQLMIWVTNSTTGGYCVAGMDGSSGFTPLSVPGVERILRAEGSSITAVIGNYIRVAGHRFYILTLSAQDRTLVLDLDAKLWLEWQSPAGGKWPLIRFAQHNGALIGQHATNGYLYTVSEATYQDDLTNFSVLGRFRRIDFDDNRRKFVKSAELIGDVQSTSTPVLLQYSDDDWNTLSTARTMDMSLARTLAPAMGNFRRRAWQIEYTGANPLRLEALDLKVLMGQY